MGKIPIIDANQSYTFADYFKLNCEPEEILEYFGYDYQKKLLKIQICIESRQI